MTLHIAGNLNTNDEAEVKTGIELNASTSTVILAANPDRIFVEINNNSSNEECWIKLQPAADDNDKKGIWLEKRASRTFETNNIYTGEISAIAATGTPTVYVTEY